MSTKRQCEWCNEDIPDGRSPKAKTCSRECQRLRKLDYNTRLYQDNVEERRQINRRYCQTNRDRRRAYQKWLRDNFPEKKRLANRRARLKDVEAFRARTRAYYARNRERIRAREQARLESLPSEKRHRNHRKHLDHLLSLQKGMCAACHCPLTASEADVDHIVPKARGGSDDLRNLQVLCGPCNRSKGARLMDEWPGRLDLQGGDTGRAHVD